MRRRVFLGSIGSAVSLGTLAYATRTVDELEVRVWFSERANQYETARTRVREYLGECLDLEFWSLDLSIEGSVPVSTEDGARVTSRGEWPAIVASGAIGAGDLEPAADVNLLVTDGQMQRAPTGYGVPHVASVGGAGHIESLEPVDELVSRSATDRPIVPLTSATRSMQVLLHEVGHALGLRHDHGVAFRTGDAVVATPMVSTYAFSTAVGPERSRCGTAAVDPARLERKLSFDFSACARRELATYGTDRD
ncbi:peptidase M10A and M12B matrixin and adamalysin [Halopiger djelfimassiliensis]|uniref:peptidase M10A and M12B matrixin and adamalysin n=1 Tax=Halopiger djelfimassiliensis TaxID=1293047 RepID=UPI0006781DC2|nr:peptidase M10A and M12B matrixin and adamalysin [Halopiger djelfimassiliensis]